MAGMYRIILTMIRLTVHFSGHVQGVGFRYTTRSIARGYPVSGFVRNLPDGRVLLVVEGQDQDVRALVQDIATRMGQHIRDYTTDHTDATGEFGQPGVEPLSIR